MLTHYQITVKGKVQGVFYRASAKQKAEELNIKGSAQNQPDGSVLIEAEGDEAQLKKLVEWCSQGPPRSFVIEVNVTEEKIVGYNSFIVKR